MSAPSKIAPRLLTKAEAAAYCGISAALFDRLCPVRPLRFSERLVRFDVSDIDSWIEALEGPAKNADTDWLEVWERANSKGRPLTT
jgi:predicted DNA-binding transcriptional regulator AlpA